MTLILVYFAWMMVALYLFAGGYKGNKSTVFMFNCTRGQLGYSIENFLEKNPNYKYGKGFDSARCYPLDYCADIYLKGEEDYVVHVGLVSANLEDTATTSPSYISIRSIYNVEENEWSNDYDISDNKMEYLDETLKNEVWSRLNNDSCECAVLGQESR